ncbi:cytochrome c oxidase subunit 3 [Pseudalkalibacillus salsuginis]|uniref:cytochrome c oxidase subunit 3 n=1 Tax=Pseudalkalibacillus salsuginis TaxID=2910972 RepID=UPI001F2E6277|nr:cytochrome c oxidase subunit 3 [Pseudalkalibacillus salsuginis]MCF6410038.1 cytochrome c oxidase subunit 3 [Pseudalkalibacillus salsuginis]
MAEEKIVFSKEFTEEETADRVLGLWFFIGAEIVLFGCLFGVYLTLNNHTVPGESPGELFELKQTILATFLLLSSSFTCAQSFLGAKKNHYKKSFFFLISTFVLGAAFLGLEAHEFFKYVREGHTFTSSPFMSSFYILVGTHGTHVLAGCTWMVLLLIHLKRERITSYTKAKLEAFSLYWHFVDVVWIFIFTVVYLIGKAGIIY